jgi:hypothetical protein
MLEERLVGGSMEMLCWGHGREEEHQGVVFAFLKSFAAPPNAVRTNQVCESLEL